MTYAVTFTNKQTNNTEYSRSFEKKQVALKWAEWLRNQRFVSETTIYQGELGGNVIERKVA